VGSRCPPSEDSAPVYTAKYLGNGIWSVTKVCPVNANYNGSWNFYESTGELVKSK